MGEMLMASQIQIRRDSSANWASINPILAEGEYGLDLDTNKLKHGDGATAWNSLDYCIPSQAEFNALGTSVGNKVDKVTGKQLSTEDYTTNEKNKLAGIETGANNYIHPAGTNPHGTTKSDVGLSSVNNTSDANKPISTAMQTALNDKANNNDVRFDNGKVIIGITQPANQTCLWIDTN